MSEQQPAPAARVSVYGFFVVILLSAVYTFNFLDRQLLSILSEPIRKDLGLSYTQVGMLTGLTFALFYTTFGIPLAWLADRTHRVRIIAAACAVWSLFSMVCGLAVNFSALALARIGVGVGEAGGSPPSYSLIADYFPPQRRGVALAIYALGVPMGTALGSAAGAKIASIYGWRMAFFAVGAPGIALALLVLLLIREPKRGRFDALAEGETAHAPSPPILRAIAGFFTNRTLVLTALSSGLSSFVGYAILNNGPAFLISNKGMTLPEIALYYSAMSGLAGGLGTFGSGWLVDLFGKRHRTAYALVPAASFVISLPFFLGFLWAPTWQTAMLCLIVPHLMNNMYLAPAITVVQNAVAPAQRGISGAILLFILNLIGLGGGPVYVGLVADHFKPIYGTVALKYGLAALVPFYILTILAHLIASRSIKHDTTLAARLATTQATAEPAV
jgi:predicted MFS family arabinose efflux permease